MTSTLIDPAAIAAIRQQQPAPDTARNLARSRAVSASEWRQAWGRSSTTISEVVQDHLDRDGDTRLGAQLMDRMLDLIAYSLSVAVESSPTARRTIRNKCEEILGMLARNLEDTVEAGVQERTANLKRAWEEERRHLTTQLEELTMPAPTALERTSLCLYARTAMSRPDLTQNDLPSVPEHVRTAWQAALPTPADQMAQLRAVALPILGRTA